MPKAQIIDPAGEPHTGDFQVDDYTWSTAAARSHGQARAAVKKDHEILENPAITTLSGVSLRIPHALLGDWSGIQLGQHGHGEWSWSLQCYQISQMLNLLTVPAQTAPMTNLPAGVIAREALRRALADAPAGVPLFEGWFSEAPPIVESFQFTDQTVGQIFTQLMDLTGQEYQVSEQGRVDWVAPVGDEYPDVLTEGFDFVLLGYEPASETPVRRVIVTDQRGEQAIADAPEHATKIAARVVRQRADTVNVSATRAVADGLLAVGRVEHAVYTIGLLPKGGTIAITLPGIGGLLFGEGLFGAGPFGGGSGSDIDVTYPIIDAPHWSGIREGDFVRVIAPTADLRGRSDLCRVLSRTYGDKHLFPVLRLVTVPQWTAATVNTSGDLTATHSPQERIERLIVAAGQAAGPPVDTARLNSQLAAFMVPAIGELEGTIDTLSGAITAGQMPGGGTGVTDPTGTFADLAAAEAWAKTIFDELGTRGAIN